VRVITSTLGNLTNDPFKITVLAVNTYIPIYAFHTYYQEEGVKFYSRPSLEKGAIRKPNTLKHIKDALEMAIAPRRITIGGKFYYFLKGAMYTEEGIPLMVLGMSRQAFEDPDIKNFSELRYGSEVNPVDYKNFVMFYSTSFFTDPNLAPLNRRFQKELMMSCYQKGIEVRVITSSEIEKNTFANIFEIPKANSVSQLEEYMNKVLPTFLYAEEEDTFVFEELRAPEIVQDYELSVEEEALLFDSETSQELPGINPTTFDITLNTEEVVELLPIFRDPEIEEMEREAATWDSAHTESPYLVAMDPVSSEVTITERRPHPTGSLVERMRPSQDAYNMQMQMYRDLVITGEAIVYANGSTISVGSRGQARDNRPIELIDDTE
jgi:hypothetical protein